MIKRMAILPTIILAGTLSMGVSVTAHAWQPALPNGVHGPVSWYQNGKDGRYFVPVLVGRISEPTTGIVKTDSNCAADSQGLSHCRNIIQLQSKEFITIQNTHKMSNYRCLRVGEQVQVQPNGSTSWAIVQTGHFR